MHTTETTVEMPVAAETSATAASVASERLPAVQLPEVEEALPASPPSPASERQSVVQLPEAGEASRARAASGPSWAAERQSTVAMPEAGESVPWAFLESMVDQCTCPITLVRHKSWVGVRENYGASFSNQRGGSITLAAQCARVVNVDRMTLKAMCMV